MKKQELVKKKKYKIILNKEDYNFLNFIYEKYKIPEGKGIRIFMEVAINEYKINIEKRVDEE